MNYSIIKKRVKIIYFLIFFIFSTNLLAINKQDFENLIDVLNRNYEQYEITKASNILAINENLINKFISEFEEVGIEEKILLFNDVLGNLTSIKANTLLKVISNDLKENNSFERLGNDNLIIVKELFNKLIPISYEDDREINDNGYSIALIVNFSSTVLSNEIIKTVSDVSNVNNNSKALASNVIYNISNINSELLLEIDSEQSQRLIQETVKELNNSIIKKKDRNEINSNVRFSNKNALTAVSETILLSTNSISNQITTEIKKINLSNRENISFRIIEKILDLENWRNDKDDNIIKNKNNFTEKIYPIGFKNFNKKKINLAEKIIYNSDIKTSEILLKSIINEIGENNNFITLNNVSLINLKSTFLANTINKTNLIRSQNEAEAVLDSLYNNEKFSNVLLTNKLLLPAYKNIQKNNFENLENVSPN